MSGVYLSLTAMYGNVVAAAHVPPKGGTAMMIRRTTAMQIFMLVLTILLASCNVFDPLYSDDGADDFDKALSNAEAAMKRDDFSAAVQLYIEALGKKPNSSEAMIGLSSAIVLRDIQIKDVPTLMNAIFNIDASGTNTNSFLSSLSTPSADYKAKIIAAVSNAAWYRAPVIGIDRVTGSVRLGSNNLPWALPSESDGVIPSTDRNVTLNYLIIKAVHVALTVQEQFVVTQSLVANIDTDALTTFDATQLVSTNELANRATFTNFHVSYTNTIASLSNTYLKILGTLTATNNNASLLNLIGVADGMVNLLQSPDSGMSADSVARAVDAVSDIRTSLTNLVNSITNDSTGLKAGFDTLSAFRIQIENFAKYTNILVVKSSNWMPY